MKTAVQNAKLGQSEKLDAIKRLDKQAQDLEQHIITGPTLEEIIGHEREVSSSYGGKSVFGEEK